MSDAISYRDAPPRKAIGIWLLVVAFIILCMVAVGGLTRITGSGLSITQWNPIMGAIPPLSHEAWADAFARYRQIPQYIHEHEGMSLAAFKGIFWWEWTHRFLGRFLGVVFLVPFLWFAWTGVLRRADWPRMVVLFFLGGLQGFIGWWMVESGLEVRDSVSQYRLAIHLGFALILLGAILWTALGYLRPKVQRSARMPRPALIFLVLVYAQILLGALVAGLHAGLIYNTWPSMNGRVFPEGSFFYAPWWINFFNNPGLAQFDHRIGAYIVGALAVWLFARGIKLRGYAKASAKLVAVLVTFQIALGITMLVLVVPEALAALHQVTAACLFCAAVWHLYEARYHAAGARIAESSIHAAGQASA